MGDLTQFAAFDQVQEIAPGGFALEVPRGWHICQAAEKLPFLSANSQAHASQSSSKVAVR